VKGITSFKNLQRASWIVASHYPVVEAYAPINRAQDFFGITVFICIAATVLLISFLARGMAQPLTALAEHVRALPFLKGDARQTRVTTIDEIGELAAAFNKMVGNLDLQQQLTGSLLENTSTPLFVINTHHEIIFWNLALARLTGFPAEAMVGTSLQWQPFYGQSRPTLADLVMDREEGRVAQLYQHFHHHQELPGIIRAEGWYPDLNGSSRYIYFDAAPVHDPQGRMVAVIETLHDITERKLAEESLRLFSTAVEQSASAIVLTDIGGTIQYVNHKFSELTGYTREEAVGQTPRILKSGRQGPDIYAELWQTITSGLQWHGELHNRRKDGSLYWELVTISPVHGDDGSISHFLAVKEDISERKQNEYTLRKQQAELILRNRQQEILFQQVEMAKREWEETMNCIDDILILADGDHRIRRCNRALMDFSGQRLETLIGSDWRGLFPMVAHSGQDTGPFSGELFHEASGRWFNLRVYNRGETPDSVIALHDLTEVRRVSKKLETAYADLKETHMQLLHQEKMASIGQLAAGIAHEINNPMGFVASNLGILGTYTERLRSFIVQQDTMLDPQQQKALAESRGKLKIDYLLEDIPRLLAESVNGADRVNTIVRNLKSFSRLDESELTDANVNEYLESTISIAWNELKYKCTVERQYGRIPLVRCRPQQLNQVFLNLMINGAQAIERQGTITVRSWQEGDVICVSVSDTGSGIPEEIRRRIFEPFFTTKEVGKGTGLGLSISYDIIKGHGGTIDVQSAAGGGTTFTVRLPLAGPVVARK
jgi:two-component system NtrC family sensor kinase